VAWERIMLITGLAVLGVCCLTSTCFVGALVRRERSGRPMFNPLMEASDKSSQPPQEIGNTA